MLNKKTKKPRSAFESDVYICFATMRTQSQVKLSILYNTETITDTHKIITEVAILV